jgi:hypothetical protein
MYIVGIDPGKNGGIVALNNGKVVSICTMPSTIGGIWDHFIYLGFPNMIKKENTYVYIEDVHSMPTDGVVSAFSFGRHLGILDTCLDRLVHSPVIRIKPRIWLDFFNLRKDKEKGESQYQFKKRILEYARNYRCNRQSSTKNGRLLFRTQKEKAKLTLKTCDAYLIALYGDNQIKEINNG